MVTAEKQLKVKSEKRTRLSLDPGEILSFQQLSSPPAAVVKEHNAFLTEKVSKLDCDVRLLVAEKSDIEQSLENERAKGKQALLKVEEIKEQLNKKFTALVQTKSSR